MSGIKKINLTSLGCPKNLVDAEIMVGTLKESGFDYVESAEEADAIIVNTCGFIEDAKRESIEKIFEMAKLKKDGKLKKLIVSGCLSQRYKDDLVKQMPEVDVFIGSGSFQDIAKIIKESETTKEQLTYFNLPTYLQDRDTPRQLSGKPHSAFLKISEGCKKRCAFCSIPLIRGNLQSRPIDAVVSEAKLLVAGGVKEIIVISHDFTDYGWDLRKKDPENQANPYNLLKRLSEESGAKWIRVMYLYPDGINEPLVKLIKEKDNLVNYFDIPLQHINDDVLKLMNRRMKKSQITDILKLIRKEIPEAIVRTQFIVGFPGETSEQFEELVDFIKDSKFDRVGCFKYSPEEDTKGFTLDNRVDSDTMDIRHDKLMSVQAEISKGIHKKFIGRTIEVIVEGVSEETELLLQGRNFGQAPEIDGVTYISSGNPSIGDLVKVKITDSHQYDLVGELVE